MRLLAVVGLAQTENAAVSITQSHTAGRFMCLNITGGMDRAIARNLWNASPKLRITPP
jgi:hypothetical protein